MTEKTMAAAKKKPAKPAKPRSTRSGTRATATTRKATAKPPTSADAGTVRGAGQTPAVREALLKARARVAETNTAKAEKEQDGPVPKTGGQPAPSRTKNGKSSPPAARSEAPAHTGEPGASGAGQASPAAGETGATPPAVTDPAQSGNQPDAADSVGTPAAGGNVAGTVADSSDPDNAPTTANATTSGRPAAAAGRRARLGRGELRWMVQDRLYVNPGSEYTAGELSHLLGHSSGAIFNALVKLCDLDVAIQTAEKPKTFAWATDTRRRAGIRPTRHPIGAATEAVLAAASQPAGNTQPEPAGAAPDDTAPAERTDAGADEG